MADPMVIVCTRARDRRAHVVGTSIGRCSRCDEIVWVAPSTVSVLRRVHPEPVLVCVPCLEHDEPEALADAVRTAYPNAEQLVELAAWREHHHTI